MKIRLEDIPSEGRDYKFELNISQVEELGPQVKSVDGPLTANLRVSKKGQKVLISGEFDACLTLECSRCLGDTPVTIAAPVELAFMPQPDDGVDEIVLAEDDLTVAFWEKEEIDLARAVRDELALALPMAPLCSPECMGICPNCGNKKTKEVCDCQTKKMDPRWAELARLKEDK